ncbi:cAMP-dependent protein kinase catalytic subunit alpha-like isoform X2 [Bacillus rossius redtenbacheri]|uniref:cAMP-dependent protein kinase catalytic subunit alpha-like isoform X2 n=1 Tax=Bacillus rossius redtenbacheri TaxID=93214 RepID=UPI002FDD71A2
MADLDRDTAPSRKRAGSKRRCHSGEGEGEGEGDIADFLEFCRGAKEQFRQLYDMPAPRLTDLAELELCKTLGKGSFGSVRLARNKSSGEVYAVKIISKKHVVKNNQLEHVWNEVKILSSLRFSTFPFVVRLEYFHKDNSYLYCVMPCVSGGELFMLMRKVLLALEFLHRLGLVHRDLKLENVLVDAGGYLRLADFGSARPLSGRAWTVCGTPEYFAPEVVACRGYRHSVDWWSLGVLLFEMCAGFTPFQDKSHARQNDNIIRCRYCTPSTFSPELRDLVKGLLQADITRRYGCMRNGADDIKNHKWFTQISWTDVLNQRVKPSYVPRAKAVTEHSNFDRYEEEDLVVSDNEEYADEFKDF